MSGTSEADSTDLLGSLEAILRRDCPLDVLSDVALSLDPSRVAEAEISRSAVCFDTNVLLKLASHASREEIVDYFLVKHSAPLVISAQSVQEFWNSQLAGVETIATSIDKKFSELAKEVEKLGEELGGYSKKFSSLLHEFHEDYGHLHDPAARRNLTALVDMLGKRALLAEVPRHRFYQFAAPRQRTKTPPGFKDNGDGDFYVWLDFLYGVASNRRDGREFQHIVMVTDDRKVDWSRGGVPHPTLVAEAKAFLGVPLEVWSLKKLAQQVEATS